MSSNASSSSVLKALVSWLVFFGTAGLVGVFLINAILSILYSPDWLLEMARHQFPATIGLPFAAISALCLVLVLEIKSGPVEFEGFGFKFRGASGPVVMWVFSFLAIVAAIKALWQSAA